MRFDNLYLKLQEPGTVANIRVTDVRFYDSDHATIKRGLVADVNRRLASGVEAHVMLGLARPLPDDEAGDVQWLMANGLCLADRPVSDVP